MTYFSDFDYVEDYDDPFIRDRIIYNIEEQYFDEDIVETELPWDLLDQL